jgi:hypothetical protein
LSSNGVWKISLAVFLSLSFLLAGCGGVSSNTLRPLWTKQVNQDVAPMMKDVFAPVSSHVTTTFQLSSNDDWDVTKDKLPDFKYALQHAKGTVKDSSQSWDPNLTIRVVLDQPIDTYQSNQLVEQIWSAKQTLKINGINRARVMITESGKVYFDGWLQEINKPGDVTQYLHMKTNG